MTIEVFNAGGGIWLAETDLNNGTYAVISTDAPEYLSVYNYVDDEPQYLPDDMIFSKGIHELNDNEKTIYNELYAALNRR